MKSLLFAACMVLTFASCKNEAANKPVSTISATIDGVNENFTTGAVAKVTAAPLNYHLSIDAATGTGVNADALSIFLSSGSKIGTGTYTNAVDSSGNFLQIVYLKGAVGAPVTYNTDYTGAHPSSLTITAISTTNVQGTFSGQLLLNDGDTLKTVADGKFNLAIK